MQLCRPVVNLVHISPAGSLFYFPGRRRSSPHAGAVPNHTNHLRFSRAGAVRARQRSGALAAGCHKIESGRRRRACAPAGGTASTRAVEKCWSGRPLAASVDRGALPGSPANDLLTCRRRTDPSPHPTSSALLLRSSVGGWLLVA
jgi:hypothetical protein